MRLRAPGKNRIVLPATHPSAAVEAWYRSKLEGMIKAMDKSLMYWIKAAYRAHPRTMEDASPTKILASKMQKLARQWQRMFDHMSKELAGGMTSRVLAHTDLSFSGALRKAGFSIKFQLTNAMRDAYDSKVAENVNLIKSIAHDHLREVQAKVLESVQKGRSLKELTEQLKDVLTQDQPGWSDSKVLRRARLIARDQNNKATSLFVKTRQKGLGITKAVWSHTSASIHPREEHEAFNGEEYDVEEGHDFDDGFGPVVPGEAINCLPGNSIVRFSAGCKKFWRRWYDGELSKLISESGEVLCATPNHPILTQRGWVPIELIDVGDYIIKVPKQVFNSVEANIEDRDPTVEEFFTAFSNFLGVDNASGSLEFHGDTSNGQVDVIDIDGFLGDELDAEFCKEFCEFFFSRAIEKFRCCAFTGSRFFELAISRLFGPPQCVVSGFSSVLAFFKSMESSTSDVSLRAISDLGMIFEQAEAYATSRCSVLLGDVKHTETLGVIQKDQISRNISTRANFGGASSSNTTMPEVCSDSVLRNSKIFGDSRNCFSGSVTGNDFLVRKLFGLASRASMIWLSKPPQLEMTFDGGIVKATELARSVQTSPFLYELDRVCKVDRITFAGHVYNLETGVGWYSACNIFCHNCGCTSRSIISGYDEDEEDEAA